jgi:Ring finger domain
MSVKRKQETCSSLSYVQEKPEDCIICTEKMEEERSLECGHWIHYSCIQKQFKAECPVCRKSLKIEVKGKRPSSEVMWREGEDLVRQETRWQEALWEDPVRQGAHLVGLLENYGNIPYLLYGEDERDEESEENEEDYDEENPSGDSEYYD